MVAAAIAFLIALIAAMILTPVARRAAHRLGAIDHALGSRRVHGRPIPRLGGLAVVAAFYLALVALAFADPTALALFVVDPAQTAALLLGGLVIAGLGLHDDLHGATAGSKLFVEFAVAGLLYAAGFRIDAVALPFLPPMALGWLGLPITLVWIAGVINAVNLVDGLDGLAAGVALVAAAATGLLAIVGGNALVVILAAALGGAALGFLRHNFHPASIFMGDTGSLFLGFVLAATSIRTHHESSTAVGLLASALVLGLPIADTALAIGRRALRGAPLFRADRGHIHHRLLARGIGHRGAVLVLYGASLLLSAAAVLLAVGSDALDAAVLATLALACPAALWWLGFLRVPRLAALLEERRRNLALRASLDRIRVRLRRAGDWNEVWPSVRQAADLLGAGGVALRVAASAAGGTEASYSAGDDDEGLLCARSSLAPEAPGASLELRWRDRATLDRDTEIAFEILCGELSSALCRIRRRRHPARPSLPSLAASVPSAVWAMRERERKARAGYAASRSRK